jgi:DNA repair exonuclease SbcCD ATPase subunit
MSEYISKLRIKYEGKGENGLYLGTSYDEELLRLGYDEIVALNQQLADTMREMDSEANSLRAKMKELERVKAKLMQERVCHFDDCKLNKIKELEAEREKLVWNLAGISTICCAEQPSDFNGEWARPALHDANKMATKYVELQAKVKEIEGQVKSLRNCENCSLVYKRCFSETSDESSPIQCVECHDYSNWK